MPTEFHLPTSERAYLQTLALQQAEYAALPVMSERKQMWYALNDAHPGARPPVIIETGTFDRDFLPDNIFQCASPLGRSIEYQLLRNIRNHELIDDDKVIPDTFDIPWFIDYDEFGFQIERDTAKDAQGYELGYRVHYPLQDLERDFPKLKPSTFRVDRQKTCAYQEFLQDLFGNSLKVQIVTRTGDFTFLTNRLVQLMGMQAFFTAMHDQPAAVHRLMAYLRDNALSYMRWLEAEGLLRLNNGNQDSFGSSYNFTTRLPQPDFGGGPLGGPARLCDWWGSTNSQETVGVSPKMFREFCLPYYQEVCQPMGLVYYGCCEPASPFWNEISQLPHLKKVSISRWCNQEFMGEALRGSEIVFSRKPDPNFLSVDDCLNEEAWKAHIRQTLAATRGVFVEFIIRDVYTVHGNLENARRAVQLIRQEIEQL